MAKIINVLLHGIFGYRFTTEWIEVYTPAVGGHMYKVGLSRNYADNTTTTTLPRADYQLKGVAEANTPVWPSGGTSPVIPLQDNVKMDEFGKRWSMIRLPYPKRSGKLQSSPRFIWPVDAATLGYVYQGCNAGPLNAVETFPSMHILSYEQGPGKLELVPYRHSPPVHGGAKAKPIPLHKLKGDDHTPKDCTNVHIWCTMDQMVMSATGETETGHLRRGFAALVDLFPGLEITLNIPDGFTPAAATGITYPPGVTEVDIDPKPYASPRYGHTNCHFANILAVPTAQYKPQHKKKRQTQM